MSADRRLVGLALLSVIAIAATLSLPPVPQNLAYHEFADQRGAGGIPHFWNVISNLPFVFVGIAGLLSLRQAETLTGCLPELRVAYRVFFCAVLLVGPGSAWYHLEPNNATLLWDRLPMAAGFMAFFTAVIGENMSLAAARRLLWVLVAAGIAATVYWYWSETVGAGDLRFYGLVQFLPMLLIPLILLTYRSPFSSNAWLWAGLAGYLGAKLAEHFDVAIYAATDMGGHAFKHVLAAAGAAAVLQALRVRAPLKRP